MSVSQSLYLLATLLERADNDLLWLAILSITHQYIASKIDRDQYNAYQLLFQDEVARLNHVVLPNGNGGIGSGRDPDDRSIVRSEELRFMLFRHWNLYDAMLHSGYVAGRMGIWKEKGRKKLQGLLAKMG
jgi:cell division control protein 45